MRMLSKTFAPYGKLVRVDLPSYDTPLTLRTGTSDIFSFEKIFIDDEYGAPLSGNIRTIIDAGANIGCASVYLSQKYPNATIVAIEPDAENFRLLLENTKGFPNISCLQAALWFKSGTLNLSNTDQRPDSFQVSEDRSVDSGSVSAVTVQEILRRFEFETIDLFKIDIESAEKELFESADNSWLDKVKAIMIELHDHQKRGCSSSFYRAIAHYDFIQEVRGEVVVITKEPLCGSNTLEVALSHRSDRVV
jgi:FkbM family methyltransferase